jgi:hypothetical protein
VREGVGRERGESEGLVLAVNTGRLEKNWIALKKLEKQQQKRIIFLF